MNDDAIPGLIDYVTRYGVVDCPVNRKAYRFIYAMIRQYATDSGNQNAGIRILYSETFERYVAFGGFGMDDDSFVPLAMVWQAELADANWLDLKCTPGCEDCEVINDGSRSKPVAPPRELDLNIDYVAGFSQAVQSLQGDGIFKDADKLAAFYLVEQEKGDDTQT